jgi:hypothetical protein
MTDTTNHDEAAPPPEHDVFERIDETLDEWRGRIDELKVQLDLAAKDARDELRTRIDVAENVYLAARSGLADARNDAGSDADAARRSLDRLLRDLKDAFDAAVAVVRRSGHE